MCVHMCARVYTDRFELAEQAHTTPPHLVELDGDASLGRDARHRALAVLLVLHLPAQPQAAVDASDHCQHRHQAAHHWALGIRKVLLQHGLNRAGTTGSVAEDSGQTTDVYFNVLTKTHTELKCVQDAAQVLSL